MPIEDLKLGNDKKKYQNIVNYQVHDFFGSFIGTYHL
jgi:hypothetical protein